jgi:hypothetical protein
LYGLYSKVPTSPARGKPPVSKIRRAAPLGGPPRRVGAPGGAALTHEHAKIASRFFWFGPTAFKRSPGPGCLYFRPRYEPKPRIPGVKSGQKHLPLLCGIILRGSADSPWGARDCRGRGIAFRQSPRARSGWGSNREGRNPRKARFFRGPGPRINVPR